MELLLAAQVVLFWLLGLGVEGSFVFQFKGSASLERKKELNHLANRYS